LKNDFMSMPPKKNLLARHSPKGGGKLSSSFTKVSGRQVGAAPRQDEVRANHSAFVEVKIFSLPTTSF